MHPVRDLVRVDPDQARLRAVDRREETVELDAAELLGVRLLQARIEEAPERGTAADEVLPEPALRLVDAERARAAGREPLEMLRLLMAVEAVAVLVHRREERLEIVRVVVRRDPDVVAAGAGRERMLGRVDPPAVGAVPEEVDHLVRHRLLALDGEVAGEERVVDLAVAELRDERDERRLELREHCAHLGRLRLRLVVVEQNVVALVRAVGDEVDVLELQFDVALQPGRNEAKSFSALALTQTGFASDAAREISARSDDGTFAAFS